MQAQRPALLLPADGHCVAARRSRVGDIVKHGLTWGLGHTLTLFVFAGAALLLGRANALIELKRYAEALSLLDQLALDPDKGRTPAAALSGAIATSSDGPASQAPMNR